MSLYVKPHKNILNVLHLLVYLSMESKSTDHQAGLVLFSGKSSIRVYEILNEINNKVFTNGMNFPTVNVS